MAAAQRKPPDDGDDGPRRGRPSLGPRKAFLLRLPPDLLAELRAWSAHDLRSLNGHIEYLLREAVRRRKGGKGDPSA